MFLRAAESRQQQHRQFIEPAIPDVAVTVAVMPEIGHELATVNVVSHQGAQQGELDVQPHLIPEHHPAVVIQHPESEYQREHRTWCRDAVKQFALHDLEAVYRRLVFAHRVIHEQPRQIEKAGEPGHHADEMPCLQPHCSSTLERE